MYVDLAVGEDVRNEGARRRREDRRRHIERLGQRAAVAPGHVLVRQRRGDGQLSDGEVEQLRTDEDDEVGAGARLVRVESRNGREVGGTDVNVVSYRKTSAGNERGRC